MNFNYEDKVHVFYYGFGYKKFVGTILIKNKKIFFEYDNEFTKTGLNLSPFKLPLKYGLIASDASIEGFKNLFGIFNDSLPDAWGNYVLNRKLKSLGIKPQSLSELDRLCFIGTSMDVRGALSYEPSKILGSNSDSEIIDLDKIKSNIDIIFLDENACVDDLIARVGSSGGARPKINVIYKNEFEELGHWLIKFRSRNDDCEDIGCIEYAYNLMAKEAGLDIPEFKLFESKNGYGFFGTKRFDRKKVDFIDCDLENGIHTHTVSGLLNSDYYYSLIDYEDIIKLTFELTKNMNECEKQFRHAVFNVLSHNKDDHSKNFAFLMDEFGKWRVSPAYDLTFSSKERGYHASTIMGEGKNPTKQHLLKLAEVSNINKNIALDIIDQVMQATSKWKVFAKQSGVSQNSINEINKSLDNIKLIF